MFINIYDIDKIMNENIYLYLIINKITQYCKS